MSLLLPLLLLIVLALCVAFTLREGMWSNAIRLINLVTAGLIAMNFFEPVAKMLEEQVESSLTYFWDFVALWVIFCVSLLLLRLLTDYTISRVKVRFLNVADNWGSIVFGVLCGWFMVCFTTASLHTAPLARDFLYEGFKPGERMFFGLAPDWQWLGFVRYVSNGVYSRALSDEEVRDGSYGPSEVAVFDGAKLADEKRFINRYTRRREQLEALAVSGSFRATGTPPKR
jgi:uncharacterized membrane protein required for colicin V production